MNPGWPQPAQPFWGLCRFCRVRSQALCLQAGGQAQAGLGASAGGPAGCLTSLDFPSCNRVGSS